MSTHNGTTLFTIFRNLFQRDVEQIQSLHQIASRALLSEEYHVKFVAALRVLNDGEDPKLDGKQIEALCYVFGASAKADLVKPWDGEPAW